MNVRMNYAAVRAYRRALNGTKQDCIARMEGKAADRMFDGGEFSDYMSAVHEEERELRIARAVAARFGMCSRELQYAADHAANECHHRFLTAIGVR